MNWSAGEVTEVPPRVLTVTCTVPATCEGEEAVSEVALITFTVVAALAPKETAVAPAPPVTKPVPDTMTRCRRSAGRPPAHGGDGGQHLVGELVRRVGADVPPGVVTVRCTVPAASDGAVASSVP